MVEVEEENIVVKAWETWALGGKHGVDDGVECGWTFVTFEFW